MKTIEARTSRLGTWFFFVAGAFFLAANGIVALLRSPPNGAGELLAWIGANRLWISLANESLCFAAGALVPALYALRRLSPARERMGLVSGHGLALAGVPLLLVLAVFQGRLVYPVFGIQPGFETARLMLSLFYGGMHTAVLLFGLAIILVSVSFLASGAPKALAVAGLVAGPVQIAGSYPWLTGLGINLLVAAVFSAWLVWVGVHLLGVANRGLRSVEQRQA